MKIGIIGGTGPQGQGIALRLAKAGIKVDIGSRTINKSTQVAESCNKLINTSDITGCTNEDVIKNNKIIFLTIPYENVQSTLEPLLELIKSHTSVLVDVTVPLTFEKGSGMVYVPVEHGSMAAFIAKIIQPIPVVGALKTIGAHALLELEKPLNRDTFVFGPDPFRKEIMELLSQIDTLRAINAGSLREAECVERMVPFLININRRYKVKDSGLKVIM